jgi:N-acetylglucosaminyl-diphospho-decaprenol L-rhamnosyltransferase
MSGPPIAVVVVTYKSSASVAGTLGALNAQLRDDDQLLVVDNASADGTADVAREAASRAQVLEQPRNLGFAGGCNVGAAASEAPLLLFLNPDAEPAAGCLDALRRAAHERPHWGAWQALVTMGRGRQINSSGGVIHFLGMGWAGLCGQPADIAPNTPSEVSFASGAALVVRRDAWERVGGFDDRYFMYGEDLDLGLRMWLSGYGVGLVPAARVEHDYEFAKGDRKWMLLERNRWWTVLSDYPAGLLVPLLPAMFAAEAALLLIAARGGWLRAKLRAQATIVRELPQILERRRAVQGRRIARAAQVAELLSSRLDNPNLGGAARIRALAAMQRCYWAGVLALIRLAAR